MTLLQHLLHVTNFRSPLLRTLVPGVATAFAVQTAFAVPSVLAQSERFYDASGALTFLSVTLLSLYVPHLRTRAAAAATTAAAAVPETAPLPGLLSGAFNWRQVALSAAVAVWAIRLGSYLFARVLKEGKDSRFDKIKVSPGKFFAAWMAQATWVSLCLLPVMAVNAVPAAAFAGLGSRVRASDVVGLALYVGGLGLEVTADRQKSRWAHERHEKLHDEQFMTRGLWGRCQYPNYFGEATLWTGIATAAAGVLAARPVQTGLGFGGGLGGQAAMLGMSYISPAFVTFLLTKVSGIAMSEKKYDRRFGDRKDYQEWKKNTPKFFPKLW